MNEHGWERDERINEREREKFPHSKGTSDSLYDASGEPRSDEWWDDRLERTNEFESSIVIQEEE